MIHVTVDWCKGCLLCIQRCPKQALEQSDVMNKKGIYPPRLKEVNECNYCRFCELICPDFAITVTKDEEEEPKEPKSKLIIGGITNEV